MKTRFIILVMLSLRFTTVFGANRGLVLVIQRSSDLNPLAGISVQANCKGTIHRLLSDSSGRCQVPGHTYPIDISIRVPGYDEYLHTIKSKSSQQENGEEVFYVRLTPLVREMPELVVTGQAIPVMAKQSVYKVRAITAEDIQRRAAITLDELLSFELNNFVSNDNVLGSSVNIGGLGGQNVKILLNGIPIMGRENGNIDMGQLNLNTIKRVEMIQGPMSVMYGTNALGGVINLITQTPKKKLSAQLRSYAESVGRINFSGQFGLRHRRHETSLNLNRNFFYGWSPRDEIDRYQLWKPKEQYTGDLSHTVRWKKGSLNYLGTLLTERITNKGEPIINPYEGYAFDEYYRTRRFMQALSGTWNIQPGVQLSLQNSYQYYQRIKNRLRKDLVSLNEVPTRNVGDQDTSRFQYLNFRGTYTDTRRKNLDIMGGYEVTAEYGTAPRLAEGIQQQQDFAIFSSLTWKRNIIRIQPSARLTYNNRFGLNANPALHVQAECGERGQARLSYARGFRAPTLKEMYLQFIDQNHTIIGNPDLQPETGDHIQAGFDYTISKAKTRLTLNVQGSFNHIRNLITLAVYNHHAILRKYANIERYQNWTLNTRLGVQQGNWQLQTGGGLIYIEPGTWVPGSLIWEASLNANYTLPWKSILVANYKYNNRQPVLTIDQRFVYTNPVHVANVSLQHVFFDNAFRVQLGVRNLFNIRQTNLEGTTSSQASTGHGSANSMLIMPARSIFIDLTYSF